MLRILLVNEVVTCLMMDDYKVNVKLIKLNQTKPNQTKPNHCIHMDGVSMYTKSLLSLSASLCNWQLNISTLN